MVKMGELWGSLGSVMATVMFASAIFKQYFPFHLFGFLERYKDKLVRLVNPYIEITFDEFSGERLKSNEPFSAIQNYLSANSYKQAKRFKAELVKNNRSLVFSIEDKEEVTDVFKGVKIWWVLCKIVPRRDSSASGYMGTDEKRSYKLTFHKQHWELITGPYMDHVLEEGKGIKMKNRQRKLYSNHTGRSLFGRRSNWSHINFEHPATFDTLAMESSKKEQIKNDLKKFSESKEYYARIGKAWKRGYLLYGPPGTGKSTMIAAMANFLNYDVYDLELTTVLDNTELRSLLIDTSSKSLIVIEDIDCSLDLTGQRESGKQEEKDENGEEMDPIKKRGKEESESKRSKVTLSGLLNFIDGIWSACEGERIIVFTTNYVDKLDPALIRRGRMDKRIEMSYCCFEAFKVLAKNYLNIEWHELFAEIESLLGETNMTPADVAENLMLKSDEEDAERCLMNLIGALKAAKEEEARKKAEEEARENVKDVETSAHSFKENGFIDRAATKAIAHRDAGNRGFGLP